MPEKVMLHFYEKCEKECKNQKPKSQYICEKGTALLAVLCRLGMISEAACGGKGICGGCAVQFMKEAPVPSAADRSFFTPDKLREGMRLACRISVTKDLHLAIPKEKKQPDVIFGKMDFTRFAAEGSEAAIILADLGTTTLAMELRSLKDGTVLGQYAALNPQRRFGADVVTRMEAAMKSVENAAKLQELIVQELSQGIRYFRKLSPEIVHSKTKIYLAGNTVMLHLLLGLDVTGLSAYPFIPENLDFAEFSVDGYSVTVLPGISAFVGADIVADLYALDMIPIANQKPLHGKENKKKILADLGTNAELACYDGEKLTVTATAAGPAFEGGITAGIFGADLIKMTARLLEQGILDETGLLQDAAFENGVKIDEIHIQNQDIRKLQLAKAAVAAGIRTLEPGAEAQVYLAGGFGYYLDVDSALRIGLLPDIQKAHVTACGNLVLEGLYLIARDLCEERLKREQLTDALAGVRVVNLAEMTDFESRYLAEINFPVSQKESIND